MQSLVIFRATAVLLHILIGQLTVITLLPTLGTMKFFTVSNLKVMEVI